MWCRRSAVIALSVWLGCGAAWGEDAAGPPTLKNERWQILPADIRTVTVGPDGRPWYTKADAAVPVDLTAVKKEIEDQWKSPSAMLTGTHPVLFEKSGRIWFVTKNLATLIAYDGTQWIQQAAHEKNGRPGEFIGEAPSHGHLSQTPLNLDTGSAQAFVDTTGVLVFEGGEWKYLPATTSSSRTVLLSEPTGKILVAVQPTPPKLWRFQNGKWNELAVPASVGTNIQSAALQPSGALLLRGSANGIMRVPLGATATGPELEKQFNTYLNKIDNHDPEVADAAAQSIADMGPSVTPLVNKVLENIVDSDAEQRLRGVLAQLSGAGPQPFRLGNVDLSKLNTWLYSDPAGNLYVSAAGLPVAVTPGESGVYLIQPGGKPRLIPGTFRISLSINAPAPFAAADGKTLWLPSNVNNQGITRLDLTSQAASPQRLPNPDFTFIHDALPDGTLFLSTRPPSPPMATAATTLVPDALVAFKPTAPETRTVVNAAGVPIGDAMPVLSPDGTLSIAPPGSGINRYDGKEWTTPYPNFQATQIFAGKRGELLLSQGANFAFLGKEEQRSGPTLEELVEQNLTGFTNAFAAPLQPWMFRKSVGKYAYNNSPWEYSGDNGFSLAVDDQKRVWLTHGRELRVMNKGRWVTAEWPEANGPGPSLVMPVGNGSAMYVWSARAAAGRGAPAQGALKAYLATLQEGSIQLQPAPWTSSAPFADGEGNLWLARTTAASPPRSGLTTGRPLTIDQLGPKGIAGTFTIDGPPLLLDQSGFVWIAGPNDEMQLWKDQKIAARLTIPCIRMAGQLFSDKPGSVWAWTIAGLQHLTAAEGSAEYQAKATYAVESEEGNLFRMTATETGISPKGFLYTALYDPADPRRIRRKIYTAPLPKD